MLCGGAAKVIGDGDGELIVAVEVGRWCVRPGTGFGIDLSDLLDTSGATTVDLQRTWEDNGKDRSFSLLVDATDGRLIGWTDLSVEELG